MLTSKILEKDKELEAFIEKNIDTFTKWDIIKLLSEHNGGKSIGNIAYFLGKDKTMLEKEIETLVENKVLEKTKQKNDSVYTITSDPAKKEIVDKFLLYAKTRDGRIKVLCQILQKMQR